MTPDRRLDQLEPLVADELQKIDRLIEGQGQILEVAIRADQKADQAAKGLADLTSTVNQLTDQQASLTNKVNQLTDQQADFQEEVKREFQQVNQKFDLIIDLLRQR